MSDIKNYLEKSRDKEIAESISTLVEELNREGLLVEFGNIGIRTTYAMIYDTDHNVEIVGYTFIKNTKYYKESVGKLKALQQAIARKEIAEGKADDKRSL